MQTGKTPIGTISPGAALDVVGNINLTGTLGTADAWTAPTLSTGSNWGAPYTTAGYYKDKMGIVHLKGIVVNTCAGTIFTLPSGYRPGAQSIFRIAVYGGSAQLDVTTAGAVYPGSGCSNTWISLDGVAFRAEN